MYMAFKTFSFIFCMGSVKTSIIGFKKIRKGVKLIVMN